MKIHSDFALLDVKGGRAAIIAHTCHFTIMDFQWTEELERSVEWFECRHCGHIRDHKEIARRISKLKETDNASN